MGSDAGAPDAARRRNAKPPPADGFGLSQTLIESLLQHPCAGDFQAHSEARDLGVHDAEIGRLDVDLAGSAAHGEDGEKWQALGESNPSFQVENLTS